MTGGQIVLIRRSGCQSDGQESGNLPGSSEENVAAEPNIAAKLLREAWKGLAGWRGVVAWGNASNVAAAPAMRSVSSSQRPSSKKSMASSCSEPTDVLQTRQPSL